MQDVEFILIIISVGVCEEMCAQGVQLRFQPTISFLGHMMEQNNPHFMMDCDEQYEIPGV